MYICISFQYKSSLKIPLLHQKQLQKSGAAIINFPPSYSGLEGESSPSVRINSEIQSVARYSYKINCTGQK